MEGQGGARAFEETLVVERSARGGERLKLGGEGQVFSTQGFEPRDTLVAARLQRPIQKRAEGLPALSARLGIHPSTRSVP